MYKIFTRYGHYNKTLENFFRRKSLIVNVTSFTEQEQKNITPLAVSKPGKKVKKRSRT